MIECPICIETINLDNQDYINLDCCNKIVHISCLKEWCSSIQNKNKKICILCRTDSEILSDFVDNLRIENEHNQENIESVIDISDTELRVLEFPQPLIISKCIINIGLLCSCISALIFVIIYYND